MLADQNVTLTDDCILLAIESGLFTNYNYETESFPSEDPFLDEGSSVVIRRGDKSYSSLAIPIPCPQKYFKETVEASEVSEDGLSVTLGITVAKNIPGVDPKNWIKDPRICGIDRVEVLEVTIDNALTKMVIDPYIKIT